MVKRASITFKAIAGMVAVAFAAVFLLSDALRVKNSSAATMNLPEPAKVLRSAGAYDLPVLKGLKVDINNPLNLEFVIDGGDKDRVNKRDVALLTNYFLAGVTMPGEDLWVNLSPYESDRIISDQLSQTDLGKDMLAQDYVLKQFVSSLTAPTERSGKTFWQETLEKVAAEIGTTNVPVNTFNKVWIVPGEVEVAEDGAMAVITKATMKVMLEQDYLALNKANTDAKAEKDDVAKVNKITEDIVREKILPIIEKEVNEGKNFATTRQMYNAAILSTWFRQKMLNSFYKHYMNTSMSQGIEINEKEAKAKIYKLYTDAFKKGVYDFMAKEKDLGTGKTINRHYFSGGLKAIETAEIEKKGVFRRGAQVLADGLSGLANGGKKAVLIAAVILSLAANAVNAKDFGSKETVSPLRTRGGDVILVNNVDLKTVAPALEAFVGGARDAQTVDALNAVRLVFQKDGIIDLTNEGADLYKTAVEKGLTKGAQVAEGESASSGVVEFSEALDIAQFLAKYKGQILTSSDPRLTKFVETLSPKTQAEFHLRNQTDTVRLDTARIDAPLSTLRGLMYSAVDKMGAGPAMREGFDSISKGDSFFPSFRLAEMSAKALDQRDYGKPDFIRADTLTARATAQAFIGENVQIGEKVSQSGFFAPLLLGALLAIPLLFSAPERLVDAPPSAPMSRDTRISAARLDPNAIPTAPAPVAPAVSAAEAVALGSLLKKDGEVARPQQTTLEPKTPEFKEKTEPLIFAAYTKTVMRSDAFGYFAGSVDMRASSGIKTELERATQYFQNVNGRIDAFGVTDMVRKPDDAVVRAGALVAQIVNSGAVTSPMQVTIAGVTLNFGGKLSPAERTALDAATEAAAVAVGAIFNGNKDEGKEPQPQAARDELKQALAAVRTAGLTEIVTKEILSQVETPNFTGASTGEQLTVRLREEVSSPKGGDIEAKFVATKGKGGPVESTSAFKWSRDEGEVFREAVYGKSNYIFNTDLSKYLDADYYEREQASLLERALALPSALYERMKFDLTFAKDVVLRKFGKSSDPYDTVRLTGFDSKAFEAAMSKVRLSWGRSTFPSITTGYQPSYIQQRVGAVDSAEAAGIRPAGHGEQDTIVDKARTEEKAAAAKPDFVIPAGLPTKYTMENAIADSQIDWAKVKEGLSRLSSEVRYTTASKVAEDMKASMAKGAELSSLGADLAKLSVATGMNYAAELALVAELLTKIRSGNGYKTQADVDAMVGVLKSIKTTPGVGADPFKVLSPTAALIGDIASRIEKKSGLNLSELKTEIDVIKKKTDPLGGIDFNDIKVSASPLTKAMEFAPFDIAKFEGFAFKVVSLKKATRGDLAAMVG